MSERDEIIAEMREYFEQRADAEYLPGSPGGSPNEEMKMLENLGQLQDSLESHHRDLLAIHRVASHIAGVEPPTEEDTLTVKRVKQMAMMINQLSDGQAAREQEGGEAVVVKDAYDGAREDLQIWKKRALESEKLLQEEIESNARLVEVCNDLTGPTHMGEPVLPPRQGAQEAKPIAYTNGSQLFYLWDEEGEGKMFAEREGDYDIALYTHPPRSQGVPEWMGEISESLKTQDNRITADPLFAVFQKSPIVVDEDYDHDRIIWVDEEGNEADTETADQLNAMRSDVYGLRYLEDEIELGDEDRTEWRRLAIKEVDQFVTACFTEAGANAYLKRDGHNLNQPFIFVTSLYRNEEMKQFRDWLLSTPAAPQADEWVKCENRLPTEANADCIGSVWFTDKSGDGIQMDPILMHWSYVTKGSGHWKPTGLTRPQPPEQGEGHHD